MPRAVMATSLRPSDVMRLYQKSSGLAFGKRIVVVEREVLSDTVRVTYRALTGGKSDRRISDSVEGITFLNRKILFPIEGIWEGELVPGSRGRVVEYNNRRYIPSRVEGEDTKVPTKTSKGAKSTGRAAAKSKPAAERAPRATDAQLDKLSAQVVKLRDTQGKGWDVICEQLDITPSRARQLYNRGGGEPTARKAPASKPAARTGRGGAASKRKGKRNPS